MSYSVVSTVLAMVYVRHASHLQTREWNGGNFVYSKLIVKRPYSRWLAFLFYACSLVAIQGFFCTSILPEENSQKV